MMQKEKLLNLLELNKSTYGRFFSYHNFFYIKLYGDIMYLISDGGITSCNISNTFDAIMLTKNIDYIDGIKLDLQMTKDKIIVLFPKNELETITYSNKKISEENYSYIRKVKFPSHIFHYYIPTLEEILYRYNYEKIIVLNIPHHSKINSLLEELSKIIQKYPYKYYYSLENNLDMDLLKNNKLLEIGSLIDNNFIITKDPKKYYEHGSSFDNNFNL